MISKKNFTLINISLFFVVFFSICGLIASFLLTVDKIHILENPDYVPPCNINPIFSCKSVMMTDYAEMFGFPNTIIGLIGYSVMLTIAVFMLFGGKINKIFLILTNLGGFLAFLFSYLLLWISMYKIGALCPYCLLSCFSATNIFFAITLVNLKENVFGIKDNLNAKIQKLISGGMYLPIIVLWHLLIVAWIIMKFPDVLVF